jgi:hypothetical protein
MTITQAFSDHFGDGVTDVPFDAQNQTVLVVSFTFDQIPDGTSFPDSDPEHILRAGWVSLYAIAVPPDTGKFVLEPRFLNFKKSIFTWNWPNGALGDGVRLQLGPNGSGWLTAFIITP